MKAKLFNQLMQANSLHEIVALVNVNFALTGNKQDYLNHLSDNFFKMVFFDKNINFALRVAKQRACQMMGGTDEQMKQTFAK